MKTIALTFAALMLAGAAHAEDTLFADMGGKDVITRVANDTADNFLADPRVAPTVLPAMSLQPTHPVRRSPRTTTPRHSS